jgi:hypothetical protein
MSVAASATSTELRSTEATRGNKAGTVTESDQRALDTMAALADTCVALADMPVDEFDTTAFLNMLTERCVELFGVAAAGLLLVDHHGTLNLVGASTEGARLLELFQQRSREGPCLDCCHSGQPVRCPDLAATPTRWPREATAAVEAGFAAVHTLPMRLRDEVIGGLDLFDAFTLLRDHARTTNQPVVDHVTAVIDGTASCCVDRQHPTATNWSAP